MKKLLEKGKPIVIAGNGNVGEAVFRELRRLAPNVEIVFCDNNKSRIGVYNEYIVYSFEEAVKKYPNALYLTATKSNNKKIEAQLKALGITKDLIYSNELYEQFMELYEKSRVDRKLTPQEFLRMEVSLVEHCNLNCKYCSHFSSIAKEEYIDVESYKKDIFRMSELLERKSGIIYLLGGEPLLHPEINKCMELSREAFPESRIIVLSNGLLIKKMENSFFEACRKNNITVCVTKYPINFDYDRMIGTLEKENIEFEYMRKSDDNCNFSKYTFDLSGKQNPFDSFTRCEMANQCHLLKKGKLYTCSVIGCVEHFCDKFDVQMDLSENDYVDIYKVQNKDELLERMAKPSDFCRFCNIDERIEDLPFAISKQEITEWV